MPIWRSAGTSRRVRVIEAALWVLALASYATAQRPPTAAIESGPTAQVTVPSISFSTHFGGTASDAVTGVAGADPLGEQRFDERPDERGGVRRAVGGELAQAHDRRSEGRSSRGERIRLVGVV